MSGRLCPDMLNPLFRQTQRADDMLLIITKLPLLQIPFPYQTCDNTAIVIVIAGIPRQQSHRELSTESYQKQQLQSPLPKLQLQHLIYLLIINSTITSHPPSKQSKFSPTPSIPHPQSHPFIHAAHIQPSPSYRLPAIKHARHNTSLPINRLPSQKTRKANYINPTPVLIFTRKALQIQRFFCLSVHRKWGTPKIEKFGGVFSR